jgi:hypothetical protein
MSRSFDGANDVLTYSAKLVDATTIDTTPVSFACWVKRARTASASEEFLMCAGSTATPTSHYIALLINSTTDTVTARSRTTSNAAATSSATIADTTNWHLVVAVFAGIADRTIYVDANAGVQNTTSRDPTSATDIFRIGATPETGIGSEFQGLIAYPTVWNNKALNSTDVSQLWNSGAGVDPTTVQSGTAIAHWRLTGNASPEPSSIGTFDLTVSGTTFSADDPFTIGGGGSGLYNKLHGLFGGKLVGKVA